MHAPLLQKGMETGMKKFRMLLIASIEVVSLKLMDISLSVSSRLTKFENAFVI